MEYKLNSACPQVSNEIASNCFNCQNVMIPLWNMYLDVAQNTHTFSFCRAPEPSQSTRSARFHLFTAHTATNRTSYCLRIHGYDLQNCAIMSYLPMAEGGLMMVLQNERILMWIMPRENDDLIQKYEFHNGSTQAIYGYLEKHDFFTKQKHLSVLCKNMQRSRNISTFRKHA